MVRSSLRNINLRELTGLTALSFRHPVFLIPTVQATQRCLELCDEYFKGAHHGHNKANAFRHALWNLLIARRCYSWRKNLDKVMVWTKKFTDWHEDFSVNEKLPRAMDLHNNEVGRMVFRRSMLQTEEDHVTTLIHLLTNAIKINKLDDLGNLQGRLVYISEE